MKESEKKLERNLQKKVKAMGGWALKFVPMFVTGLPDQICLFKGGRIAFAEIKSTGDKPRKRQLFVHRKLRKLGFHVAVIDSTESLNKFLEQYA